MKNDTEIGCRECEMREHKKLLALKEPRTKNLSTGGGAAHTTRYL